MGLGDFLSVPNITLPDSGVQDALARNAALGQQQQHQGGGLFSGGLKVGSPLRNFIGAIADALSVAGGGQPLYQKRLHEQRSQSAISHYLGDLDPELAGLLGSGLDSETAVGLYKIRHPANEVPAALKEWEAYQGLPEDQRSSFIKFRQALNPQILSPITLGAGDTYDPGTGSPAVGALPHVTDQSSYDAVPPGSQYTTPDGHTRMKPGGQTPSASGGFL